MEVGWVIVSQIMERGVAKNFEIKYSKYLFIENGRLQDQPINSRTSFSIVKGIDVGQRRWVKHNYLLIFIIIM